MRIAVQNPRFLMADQRRNYDGYNFAFVKKYQPVIFLTGWRARLTRGVRWKKALAGNGLDPNAFKFVFSAGNLSRHADVLMCFNQGACLARNRPPKRFNGFKVWHVMDFNYFAAESYRALREGGVDYLMAYTDLGRHCGFFQKYYPTYVDKVLPVPFGFGERFIQNPPPRERIQKVLAIGAINPVDQGGGGKESPLNEYAEFYRAYGYSQMWRKKLSEHEDELRDVLDSYLPRPPAVNRPADDAVQLLNSYALFANDESICGFPPARTYEGTASGAVMVSADHDCFRDLGFVHGVNCIMHKPLDILDFRKQVTYYLHRPDELRQLAEESTSMVRRRFTHDAVAAKLHETILEKWETKTRQGVLRFR